jgi:UDP-N-acetylglucosamine transferase subunit ALG13
MAALGKTGWSVFQGLAVVIFVTVGTQLPFDRLVAAVDDWAGNQNPRPDVLAQVGEGRSDFPNLRCVRSLDAAAYERAISAARLIVAHAGTGSILAACDRGLPIVIMARDHRRGEHRDDHQIQTATKLEELGLARVAWSTDELAAMIDEALRDRRTAQPRRRSTELVDFVRSYLVSTIKPRATGTTRSPAS